MTGPVTGFDSVKAELQAKELHSLVTVLTEACKERSVTRAIGSLVLIRSLAGEFQRVLQNDARAALPGQMIGEIVSRRIRSASTVTMPAQDNGSQTA